MAVSLFLICCFVVFSDAAIVEILSILPGMVPPYDNSTFIGGYARIDFRYQDYYGGPASFGAKSNVECATWLHTADGTDAGPGTAAGTAVGAWGRQSKLTTTGGDTASFPEPFLTTPVSTILNSPYFTVIPGLNISMQLQCRYVATEGPLCISSAVAAPANTTTCIPSPLFYFVWAPTPNIPPLIVSKINSSYINVSWVHDSVVQGYQNRYYELQQSYTQDFPAGGFNTTIIPADRYDTAANQTKIQNMTAGAVYWWRMRAYNGYKYSNYSTSFQIIAEDPPLFPTNVRAVVYNKTTFNITWDEQNTPGLFANRSFQCATVQNGGLVRLSTSKPYLFVGGNDELFLGQTYYCSVQLKNDAGSSDWGNAPPTKLAVVPDPPTNVSYSVDTSTSAKLSWTAGNFTGDQVKNYTINYTDADGTPNWQQQTTLNDSTIFILKPLLPGHVYNVMVLANNGIGPGNYSTPLLFQVTGSPNITKITAATDTDGDPNNSVITVPDTIGGQVVVITGQGFDVFGAVGVTYGGPFSDQFTCTITASSTTSVTCALDAGVGKNLAFIVHSGSVNSTPSNLIPNPVTLSYPPPSINNGSLHRPSDVQPYDNPLAAENSLSEVLIFTGTNFGPNNPKNILTVTYGNSTNRTQFKCDVVDFNATQISCLTERAPGGDPSQLRNLSFQVTAGGQTSGVGNDTYNYPVIPVIDSVSGCPRTCASVGACDCPTRGQIPLTITGRYLTTPLNITIRGVQCQNVKFTHPPWQATCDLPEGTGGLSLPVVGTQATFTSVGVSLVSYKTPTLTNATGCPSNLCSRSGGDWIDIMGANFGKTGANAFVGGIICTQTIHVTNEEHEHIRCLVPPGAGQGRVISVLQLEGDLSVDTAVTIDYHPCEAGTEPIGFNGCQNCTAGKFTSGPGLPQCVNCSAGSYNDTNHATMCTPCGKGKYTSGLTPDQCLDCDKGKYTASDNQAACIECEVGTVKASPSSADCDICPIGKYQDLKGKYECQGCTPGKYADSPQTITCKDCEPGKASNNQNETICTACLAGEFQPLPGQTECLKCLAGKFSPVNSSVCLNCSAGFYSPQNGSSGCLMCPNGTFQSSPGMSSCDPCQPGEYKIEDPYRGSVSCLVCPAGQYSNQTNSSSCDLCSAGTHQNVSKQSNCDPCQKGQYQPLEGKIDCLECDNGYYNPDTGRSECLPAPSGFYAVKRANGTLGAIGYLPCNEGYTSSSDHTGCTLCPSGRYNNQTGSNCSLCDPGNYAPDPHDLPDAYYHINIECITCGAGKYAPVFGSTRCYDCAKGLFALAQSQQCDKCPGGSIVDDTQSVCTNCSTGKYAPEGALDCTDCPIGKFSNYNGTAVCSDCSSGTASNLTGVTTCGSCNEGSSSRPGSPECVKCDLGTFAPQTGTTTCFQCGPGTFVNNTGQTVCIDCAPGSYSSDNSSKVCNLCVSGYYTGVKRSTYCIKCPARTFSGGLGNTICGTCGKGYVVNRDSTGCLDDYWQEQEVVGFYSFLGAAGLGTIVLTVLSLIYLRENRLIYYSSPPFMYTILAGMSLVWASVILIIVNQQPWICHLKYVFLNIGTAIVLMCVTTKTWRLHRIFNRNKQDALKTVVIKDSTLFVWVFAFVGWDILVLAVWWGVAMYSVDDLVHKCITLWEPWVHIALWFWKPLVILYLIYLCIKVRSIDERFNESWWIGIGIYNVVVVLILFLILTLTLPIRPREWFIMFDTVIAYLIGTSWALIFLPKYYQIYKKKHENEELFGTEIASDITEAEEVAEEEKHDEATEEAEKKKGISVDKGDDALTKLHVKREKKAKELNKLLKIVDRTKQRMKTDITNLNHLSSDVLALHQEIEYRKKLLNKKGVVVSNKPKEKQDLEMTAQQQSTVNLHTGEGGSDAYASPTPSKPGTELEPADEQPHLEPSSYNNYEA